MILDNNTNIRQRGIGNTNPVKLMRCERELERIYGVSKGGDRKSDDFKNGESNGTEFPLKTQSQLAEELGISPKHWRNIKNIEKLAPEIQDMVERGQVTESAVRVLGTLSAGAFTETTGVLHLSEFRKLDCIECIHDISF